MVINGSHVNGSSVPQQQLALERPPWVATTLGCFLIFTTVVDIVGNVLVIVSVGRNRRLRNAAGLQDGEKKKPRCSSASGWALESCRYRAAPTVQLPPNSPTPPDAYVTEFVAVCFLWVSAIEELPVPDERGSAAQPLLATRSR
ncbi:hypothetical protein Z043_109567 [Scleropages formosus]|uniref:Uncharacterized protein n=1 Tax=Scleropages formosus TaxID=113540 RepID=A0A0N8K095_SCLFO|nr:hypothetical protein Z043_109567 [Scleropages formosus]